MSVRRLEPRDCDRLLPLVRSAVPHLELTPADLERNLFDPDADACWVEGWFEDDSLRGAGAATLRDGAGSIKLISVDPARRRRGIGSRILRRFHDHLVRGGARLITTDGRPPVYLQPGVPTSSADEIDWFERRGYRTTERRESLVASWTDTEAPNTEEAQRGVPSDLAWLPEAVARRFSDSWASEVDIALRMDRASVWYLGARTDLLGFAVNSLWARNAFGPMGVAESQRGRGLGAALLVRALRDLRVRGVERCVVAWIGPKEFYDRYMHTVSVQHYHAMEWRSSDR